MRRLTERQSALIAEMKPGCWYTPMELGGTNGSWHSAVLIQLVKKGLVERERRGWGWVGSYRYRLVTG